MVTTSALANFPFARPQDIERALNVSVGFDGMFNRLFDDLGTVHHSINSGGFPPYNLKKDGYKYLIEMAVAGFSKDDISVHVENGVLTVSSNEKQTINESHEFVHQGIATRTFKRSWTIADDVEIKDADLVDGMLTIHLEQIIPDYKKPREIPIGGKARKVIKG
jgi:molecular chaperone IbpA